MASPAPSPSDAQAQQLGDGVKSLLRGHRMESAPEVAPVQAEEKTCVTVVAEKTPVQAVAEKAPVVVLAEKAPVAASLEKAPVPAPVPTETSEVPEPTPAPVQSVFPRWYLFAADTLLVGMALVYLFKNPSQTSWAQRIFCMGLIGFGGGLGIVGVLMGREKD